MFLYPFGDFHSLNLGWFLLQFKDWTEKIQEYLDNGGGTSENLANVIAPVFNAANSYSAGDYVLYNNELYKANQAVAPGTWDPNTWDHVLIVDEMGSGGGAGVDNVARLMIAGQYSATFAYQKYGICRYNDKLWMANTDLPAGGEAWNPAHWDEITVGAGLTGLRRSVETLSDNIENIANSLNADLNGKSVVLLGDSNAALWANTNPFNGTGAAFSTFAVGGATWTTQQTNNILAQYNAMVSAIGDNAPDYAILWCGGNDIGAYMPNLGLPKLGTFSDPVENTTFECMRHILYLFRTNYPSTKLVGIVRDNKPESVVSAPRQNYGYTIMEYIYSAWSVPVISLEDILNNSVEITNSRNYNVLSDGLHYTEAAFTKITSIIIYTMKTGMNSHKARELTVIFTPTDKTTIESAFLWVVGELFKNDDSWRNFALPQTGYLIWYDMGGTPKTFHSSIMAPSVGFLNSGEKTFVKNSTEGNIGTAILELMTIRKAESVQFSDFKNIDDGFYIFRGPYRPTQNIPTEIVNNYQGAFFVLGAWTSNKSYYQGLAFFPFLPDSSLPNLFAVSKLNNIWTWKAIIDPTIIYNITET